MREKIVDFVISAAAGFAGGMVNELVMRQAYLARLDMTGVQYTSGPPPTSLSLWVSLLENPVGLMIGSGITLLGVAADGKMGKILRTLGAGSMGWVGGKFMNNVLLPTVTEQKV